jgi:hypothetical protein
VAGQRAAETLEGAENHRDFSCWGRRKSRKIVAAGFSGHQDFLKKEDTYRIPENSEHVPYLSERPIRGSGALHGLETQEPRGRRARLAASRRFGGCYGKKDGLPKPCAVNCDSMLTIPKAYLESRITRLSERKIEEIHKAIRFALDMD